MVRSVDRRSSDTLDTMDTFALIAKAHGKIGRSHLTLHLCEAVQRRTGQPLVPPTPKGLVLLLEAMQPKVLRHVGHMDKAANWAGGKRAVQEVLRRYENAGKVRAKSSSRATNRRSYFFCIHRCSIICLDRSED